MKTKRILITFLILVIVFLPALLLNDLRISQYLYNPQNRFAIFIEQYGELPGVFVLIIAGIFWGFNNKSYKQNYRQFVKIFSSVLIASLAFYFVYMIFFYSYDLLSLFTQYRFVIIISWVLFVLITYRLESGINLNSSEKIKVFSRITLMTGFFGYVLFVEPLKIFWGRVRFRDLNTLYNNFSAWYLPHGYSGNVSFPSGHAAMGFMLLPLVILVWNKRPVIKSLIISIVCMWGVLVCLGRIVIGAHYATDVLFGSAGIILAFIISITIFRKDLSKIKN